MRQMEFKMERPGLVEPGQIVDVTEGVVAAYFYYTIEPAVAMSANYRSWQRLKSGQGKVIDVKQTPQGFSQSVNWTMHANLTRKYPVPRNTRLIFLISGV